MQRGVFTTLCTTAQWEVPTSHPELEEKQTVMYSDKRTLAIDLNKQHPIQCTSVAKFEHSGTQGKPHMWAHRQQESVCLKFSTSTGRGHPQGAATGSGLSPSHTVILPLRVYLKGPGTWLCWRESVGSLRTEHTNARPHGGEASVCDSGGRGVYKHSVPNAGCLRGRRTQTRVPASPRPCTGHFTFQTPVPHF